MLTKDVSDELQQIFMQLEREGKKPSVAILKTRLTTSVPMPALISAIRRWKASAHVPKVEVMANSATADERIIQLEQQVADLTQRLTQLEQQLTEHSS
ncbi:hypothetical protein [Vibrio palustris]|uniref:KfrA N-terminal DNA-binding domain-containing protein n=1 Tax=Vibrio palustris TaxID=1918946 RepID=A0A1R4B175_9VIBR|nr:hypothetical protein [Vibrio palustris]SJL82659.1 hypothetical protein VPAL9027_00590 [Vibrio palustris]